MFYNGNRKRNPALIALFIVAAVVAFGLVTMLLWNWLVPAVFSGPYITFIQALGILVLSKILLSSGRGHHWGRWGHYGWRERLRERMEEEHGDEGGTPATATRGSSAVGEEGPAA